MDDSGMALMRFGFRFRPRTSAEPSCLVTVPSVVAPILGPFCGILIIFLPIDQAQLDLSDANETDHLRTFILRLIVQAELEP
jgi:hypothetical protein